jgi:ParB-like nuclease domain
VSESPRLYPDPGQSVCGAIRAKNRRRRQSLTELARVPVPTSRRNDLTPKLELVNRAPDDLVPPGRNVRKIEPAHLREVSNAIATFGFCEPVLIDEKNMILHGAVRVEAAKLLGLATIPCIRADHLSASERRLVRLALNRLGEKGSWDFDVLKIELEELILEDAPIEVCFSEVEVDQILHDADPAPVETGPLAPELGAVPVARPGDVFRLGDHRLICGDATDPGVLQVLMRDETVRLILTDEPFNVPIAGHVTSGSTASSLWHSAR